jgi:Tfp pilus assembly protein FimT
MKENHVSRVRGFSLVELAIVLTTIGLVTAAGVLGMSRYVRSSQFGGAVNTFVSDVHEARAMATAQRRQYRISFQTGRYHVVQITPLDTVLVRPMPRNVTCSSTGTVTFFPWGLTTPADVTITSGSKSRVVRVRANGSVSRV